MAGNLKDHAGTEHRPAGTDARIVSLVPSLTELLFDLGLGRRIVGRTAYCTEPADGVRSVKIVGGTKSVNPEKVLAQRPSHVIVNVDETPRALAHELASAGVVVVVTHPIAPADNLELYSLLGGIFDAEEKARDLARRFAGALARLGRPPAPGRRVLYLIWREPWMTVSADTYISRMLALIGWRTVCDDPETRYPEIAIDDALLAGADRVLFSTEPYAFTDEHVAEFAHAWPAHAAKARLVDGQMLSWYGSRAIDGLGYLVQLRRGG